MKTQFIVIIGLILLLAIVCGCITQNNGSTTTSSTTISTVVSTNLSLFERFGCDDVEISTMRDISQVNFYDLSGFGLKIDPIPANITKPPFRNVSQVNFENIVYVHINFDESIIDHCYYLLGIEKKNQTLCSQIIDPYDRLQCSAIANDNLSICDGMPDNVFSAQCLREYAKAEMNSSACAKIQNMGDSEPFMFPESAYCYSGVAVALNDSRICEEGPTQRDRDYCFFSMAYSQNNLCDKVKDEDWRKYCYAAVTENGSVCQGIQNYTVKDTCLRLLGPRW